MQRDHLCSWSDAFVESMDGLMQNPRPERAARWNWPSHQDRLGRWRHQVDAARELYRQGHAEGLRVLYDYWHAVAEDVHEQARFASETYRELRVRIKSAR